MQKPLYEIKRKKDSTDHNKSKNPNDPHKTQFSLAPVDTWSFMN